MTVSIKDIARECNVSIAAVSRAVNNSKGISARTRDHILEVCALRGYRPNSAARSLILNKTGMIGLLIPDITNPYYAFISKGVSAYLDTIGYGLILCNSDRNKANEKKYCDFLAQKRVDGVILIPIRFRKDDYAVITQAALPLVLIDNYVNDLNVSVITNDNYTGARKIVQHLIARGYRRIGVILADPESSTSNDRLRGYMDVLQENGMGVDFRLLVHSNATFEAGKRYAGDLIERKADAIFAINDTVALGVFKHCFENGIRIPEDLALAGYDDIEQAAMLPIPLTTVHQSKYIVGEKAAEILINEIANPAMPKQRIIMQPELVVRKSCGE